MERQRTTLIICVGPNSEVVWFYSVVAQFLLLGHLKNLDLKTSENARSSHRAFRVFISKKKKMAMIIVKTNETGQLRPRQQS